MSWMASLSNSSFQELVNDIYYHLTGDILKAEGDITVIRLLEVLYDSRDIDAIRSILEMEEQISIGEGRLRQQSEEAKKLKETLEAFTQLQEAQKKLESLTVSLRREKARKGEEFNEEEVENLTSSISTIRQEIKSLKSKTKGQSAENVLQRLRQLEPKSDDRIKREKRGTSTKRDFTAILNRVLSNENKLKITSTVALTDSQINAQVKEYQKVLEEFAKTVGELGDDFSEITDSYVSQYRKDLENFDTDLMLIANVRKRLSQLKSQQKMYVAELGKRKKQYEKTGEQKEAELLASSKINLAITTDRLRAIQALIPNLTNLKGATLPKPIKRKEETIPFDKAILLNLPLVVEALRLTSDALDAALSSNRDIPQQKIDQINKLLKKGKSELIELQKKAVEVEKEFNAKMEIIEDFTQKIFNPGEGKEIPTLRQFPDRGRYSKTGKISSKSKITGIGIGEGSIQESYLTLLKEFANITDRYSQRNSRAQNNRIFADFFRNSAAYPLVGKVIDIVRSPTQDIDIFYELKINKAGNIVEATRFRSYQKGYDDVGKYLRKILDNLTAKSSIISDMSLFVKDTLGMAPFSQGKKSNLMEMLRAERENLKEQRKQSRALKKTPFKKVERLLDASRTLPAIKRSEFKTLLTLKTLLDEDDGSDESQQALHKLLLSDAKYKNKVASLLAKIDEAKFQIKGNFLKMSEEKRQKLFEEVIRNNSDTLSGAIPNPKSYEGRKTLFEIAVAEDPKVRKLEEEIDDLINSTIDEYSNSVLYNSIEIILNYLRINEQNSEVKPGLFASKERLEQVAKLADENEAEALEYFKGKTFTAEEQFLISEMNKSKEMQRELEGSIDKVIGKILDNLASDRAISNQIASVLGGLESEEVKYETEDGLKDLTVDYLGGVIRGKEGRKTKADITRKLIAAGAWSPDADKLLSEVKGLRKELEDLKKWVNFYGLAAKLGLEEEKE